MPQSRNITSLSYSDNYYIMSLSKSCRYSADWNYPIPLCRSCQRQQWEAEKDLFKDALNRTENFIFTGLRYFIWKGTSLIGPLLLIFFFSFFLISFSFYSFYITNPVLSPSPTLHSLLPISFTIHSLEGTRPSLGHQQSLVYQVETVADHFPHACRLSKVTHHRYWASKKQFMSPG